LCCTFFKISENVNLFLTTYPTRSIFSFYALERRKWVRGIVLLLGIFRRAPRLLEGCHALLTPGGTLVPFYYPGGALPLKKNLLVIYDTSSIREPPKVS
jgi:hypothetical protein